MLRSSARAVAISTPPIGEWRETAPPGGDISSPAPARVLVYSCRLTGPLQCRASVTSAFSIACSIFWPVTTAHLLIVRDLRRGGVNIDVDCSIFA
jgi:hypothetical protein